MEINMAKFIQLKRSTFGIFKNRRAIKEVCNVVNRDCVTGLSHNIHVVSGNE